MNWKKLNEEYLSKNPNALCKKYYEILITKMEDYIRIEATQLDMVGFSSYHGGGFKTKDQWDQFEIYPPNWFDKLLGVTFEDKIQSARLKVESWCERKNKQIYKIGKINV